MADRRLASSYQFESRTVSSQSKTTVQHTVVKTSHVSVSNQQRSMAVFSSSSSSSSMTSPTTIFPNSGTINSFQGKPNIEEELRKMREKFSEFSSKPGF